MLAQTYYLIKLPRPKACAIFVGAPYGGMCSSTQRFSAPIGCQGDPDGHQLVASRKLSGYSFCYAMHILVERLRKTKTVFFHRRMRPLTGSSVQGSTGVPTEGPGRLRQRDSGNVRSTPNTNPQASSLPVSALGPDSTSANEWWPRATSILQYFKAHVCSNMRCMRRACTLTYFRMVRRQSLKSTVHRNFTFCAASYVSHSKTVLFDAISENILPFRVFSKILPFW